MRTDKMDKNMQSEKLGHVENGKDLNTFKTLFYHIQYSVYSTNA